MGLRTKGKVITGEGAKKRTFEESPSPQEKEVVEQENNPYIENNTITSREAAFIISKLKQATYTGAEFELFSEVVLKLSKLK